MPRSRFRRCSSRWILFFCLVVATGAAAREIEGVELPERLPVDDVALVLNGGGVRSKWFVDVYVAGLYLRQPSRDDAAIVAADEPMAVRLVIAFSALSGERMAQAMRDGFRRSTGLGDGDLGADIERFLSVFSAVKLQDGDVFELVYRPGEGVSTSRNGDPVDSVAGMAFKRALFGIWLGDDPVSGDLKRGMLGE